VVLAQRFTPTEVRQGLAQKISTSMRHRRGARSGGWLDWSRQHLYLWLGDQHFDRFVMTSAEVGTIFCAVVLTTGPIWESRSGAPGGLGTRASLTLFCSSPARIPGLRSAIWSLPNGRDSRPLSASWRWYWSLHSPERLPVSGLHPTIVLKPSAPSLDPEMLRRSDPSRHSRFCMSDCDAGLRNQTGPRGRGAGRA
jgi:hypothetical protein